MHVAARAFARPALRKHGLSAAVQQTVRLGCWEFWPPPPSTYPPWTPRPTRVSCSHSAARFYDSLRPLRSPSFRLLSSGLAPTTGQDGGRQEQAHLQGEEGRQEEGVSPAAWAGGERETQDGAVGAGRRLNPHADHLLAQHGPLHQEGLV